MDLALGGFPRRRAPHAARRNARLRHARRNSERRFALPAVVRRKKRGIDMAAELTEIQAYPERRKRRSLGSRIRRVLRAFRWSVSNALIRGAFYAAKGTGRTYEPVEIGGRRFSNVRDTDQRWQAVVNVLRDYKVLNLLDVGCAEGWFARRAAAD